MRMYFFWQSPWAFILLLFILIVFFRKKTGTFFYSHLKLLVNSAHSLRTQLVFVPKFLKILSIIFLILALARPQTAEQKSYHDQEGLDIMIVMDISLSMLVEDMGSSVTRLSASKEVVQNFIKGRPYDRIGLIVFSGESFSKVPLTYDHKFLIDHLVELHVSPSIKPGTAIGVALANATARLKSSPEKSRTIIFLTDGENNTGFIDPETALDLIKHNNIKVYTVGVGRESGIFFINYNVKDSVGRVVNRRAKIRSRINKELMQKISSETGGRFFLASSLEVLKNIFNEIDKLETYEIKIDRRTLYKEEFEFFLQPAFFLYLISVFLSLTVFFRGI